MRSRVAVLASGRGSNLLALIQFLNRSGDRAACEIALVLSNKADAPVLRVAGAHGLPCKAFDAEDDGADLARLLENDRIDLIVLAGYLKKIPPRIIRAYQGRILNIHPGLLPAFGGSGMYGTRVHQAVITAGEKETGVTVHLVDDEYDRGPVVAQWRIPVQSGEDAESLGKRVLEVEHTVYPRIVDMVAALTQTRAK